MEVTWTKHAKERLQKRRIRTPQVMYLFAHAHKLIKVERSTRTDEGFYKYTICGTVYGDTLAEPEREICIPSNKNLATRIITVFLRG